MIGECFFFFLFLIFIGIIAKKRSSCRALFAWFFLRNRRNLDRGHLPNVVKGESFYQNPGLCYCRVFFFVIYFLIIRRQESLYKELEM